MDPAQEKACEIWKNTENNNLDVPDLENLNNEERLKEIQLTTLKERGDLITIYKLMNNLEETDKKDLIMKRKWLDI